MARSFLLAGLLLALFTPTARAVLVYQRTASHEIVAAADDGSQAQVIGHGTNPVVSPNGDLVAYFAQTKGDFPDLRLISVHGGRSRLLARPVFNPLAWAPSVWSPNSRFV